MRTEWDATRRQFLSAALSGALVNGRSDAKPTPPSDATLAEFPVNPDGDPLIVPMKIAGKEYPFVVDTGAQGTFIDDSLAPLLGPALEVEVNVNGNSPAKAHLWPKMRLGEMDLSMVANAMVVRMNLKPLREVLGCDVYGVLGFDWLKWQILHVDFRNGRIQFLRQSPRPRGTVIPLEIDDDQVFFRAVVPALGDVRLKLDTGFNGTIELRPSEFGRFNKSKVLKRITSSSVGGISLTGEMRGEDKGILDSVNLGDQRHTNVLVSLPWSLDLNPDGAKSRGAGLLGLGILSAYAVTFDFPQKRMYLNNRKLDDGWTNNHSGVACVRREGRTIVRWIEATSPWRQAGVVVGDEIVAIDGKDASKMSLCDLQRSLRQVGKPMLLRAKRDEQMHEYSVLMQAK
jgi:hypothetical protein